MKRKTKLNCPATHFSAIVEFGELCTFSIALNKKDYRKIKMFFSISLNHVKKMRNQIPQHFEQMQKKNGIKNNHKHLEVKTENPE